jgi:ATP synthase protein I
VAKPNNEDDGEWGQPAARPLTAREAAALRDRLQPVSPLGVVLAQACLGGCLTALALLLADGRELAWSAAYGSAVVVVPGALMARGVRRRRLRVSAGISTVSLMTWSLAKIGVSVAMLVLAPRLLQPLSWPALLGAMVLCMQVYWLALLWRRR